MKSFPRSTLLLFAGLCGPTAGAGATLDANLGFAEAIVEPPSLQGDGTPEGSELPEQLPTLRFPGLIQTRPAPDPNPVHPEDFRIPLPAATPGDDLFSPACQLRPHDHFSLSTLPRHGAPPHPVRNAQRSSGPQPSRDG
jgi:hypothetical protein